MNGIYHQVVIKSRFGRQRNVPSLLELGPDGRIVYLLIPWEKIRHGAVVAGALYIIVSSQGIGACSRPHVISSN